jgi:eukaryotic-like serine/threonine-protein kinase
MGILAKEIEATYEILEKMGEGGMGAVYKARHRFFDEIRVIKVMQAQIESTEELRERFRGEAKRGKQLRHPNLAEVFDFSVAADGTSYIVMEYIEGVTLRDIMKRTGGPLGYRTVVPIIEQVLDAIGFLHGRKFVHRDISPDNIMLIQDGTPTPRVKLIDLGISKSLESTRHLTIAGKFIGKVRYASPEQFSGEVDARSDIYSVGVVVYELLTGSMPITGDDYMSILAGHVSRPPRAFDETDPTGAVPPAIRRAVMKALAKRPEDRYQSAAEFSDALRGSIPEAERRTLPEAIVTRPSNLTVPIARTVPAQTVPDVVPKKRSPFALAGAAAVLLIIVGVGIALWPKQLPPPKPQPRPQTIPTRTTGTTVTVEVPPIENGQILINALPWGEVESIVSSTGVEQLSASAETPIVLSLPAGEYKVRLTNPNSKRSVTLDATVKPNALSRYTTDLDRIDADAYVVGLGLGR